MVMKKTKYTGVYYDNETNRVQVQISLGTDPVTGKRNRLKTMTNENNKPFTTLTEANRFVVVQKAKYFKTGAYSASKMSFSTFVDDEYLPHYKITVKPQTYEHKLNGIKVIRNFFGKRKLKDIDVKLVNDFRMWLVNYGYKPSYSSGLFSTFKRILSFAEQLGFIQDNPAHKVKALPKGKAKVAFWTKKEFELVLAQICIDDAYEHFNYVMLVLYFMTGMRVNEATALYWEDIDFKRKQLHVSHNLLIKNQKEFERSDDLKTANANRFIALDDTTLEILRTWRERQVFLGLGREKEFVLSYNGKPMIKSTISRVIKRYASSAGIHSIQAKGLRHSHVSYLINEFNMEILKISKRLGHSSPEITYRHYAHLYSGADRDIADAINGNINFTSAKESNLQFNGNQVIKKTTVPRVSPKVIQIA
ncbi:site-specific integrase [Carnobacterium divergens]|uniref:Site-specific integrase n=1 Tax=Carnobacterium divergens TaxID=2748 RepID=A0AAW8R8T2_CARDV|nr:tyrosine-type recombinase/integrase [Carnobacterium divergens]MDT1956939.1 site-specific integrase [Carnobacterium divergens]MDT1972909.1 site-specific integrase [Carnobacterium divergens]